MPKYDETIQATSFQIGNTEIGEDELELLKQLASNLVTAKIQANSFQIGNTEITERELDILKRLTEHDLDILKKLANGELQVAIKSPRGYYLDNFNGRCDKGDSDRTIQFRNGYDDGNGRMTLKIKS